MTCTDLSEILRKHWLWLGQEDNGERANLEDANLDGADMRFAKMQRANMKGATMQGATMQGAHMRYADMRFANMQGADMQGADMRCSNMTYANMQDANMQDTDLKNVSMRFADMRGADIDYSCWPLQCGSLKAHVDDRIAIQLLYHALSVVQHSPYVSDDIKRTLLTEAVVDIANRFHRVEECGELEIFNGGKEA